MSLPPEIIDHIIDFVNSSWTLRVCSLVAKSWVYRSQMHLFRNAKLFHNRWQRVTLVYNTSLARHTRNLRLVQVYPPGITTDIHGPFLVRLQDFRNVENLTLDGELSAFSEGELNKYFGHFGENLRSLQLNGEGMSPDSFLDLLGLLPNLEDLFVDECIEGSETNRFPATLPGLSGCLTISVHREPLYSTLCKLPLRFREICLQATPLYYHQDLINACAETLVDFRAMPPCYSRQTH